MKLVLLVFVAAFLAGCNTMEGMGRDIGKAGEKIEEAAKKK
jgi:predicted small secreted protein